MRKIFTISMLAVAVLCIISCGGDSKKPEFTATPTGVGPIQLKLSVDKIPASYDGLYDAFTTEAVEHYEGDYTVLHFTLAGAPVMDASVYYGNEIGSIDVLGSQIGSPEGIYPGIKIAELFAKGGKTTMNNMGELSITLGDLTFVCYDLKEAGSMKLQNGYATGKDPEITIDDFNSGAKVERISIY